MTRKLERYCAFKIIYSGLLCKTNEFLDVDSCLFMPHVSHRPPCQGHCESQLKHVMACFKNSVDLQFIYILFFGCIFSQNLQNKKMI